jgi:hypothetical protein
LDAAGAGEAAQALVVAIGKATAPEALSQSLKMICERQSTVDILKALQHPLAVGRAQRTLLDVLGQRTRRTFRSTWHFLDWAASNGVDLVPHFPPRMGAAARVGAKVGDR